MKRVSIAAIAAVAALTFSQIAYSADMPTRAPAAPPVATYNWTGFYVGGNVGGGWGRHHGVDSFQANDPDTVFFFVSGGTPPPASFNSSGVIGGLQLGYNWQINRELLLGVETDFDWSGIKGSSITPYAPFGASGFVSSFDERIKWFGTVRGRLGYLPTDNLLAYVTAGFAYGRVKHTGNIVNNSLTTLLESAAACDPGATCNVGSGSSTVGGWTLGGGLEYAIWQRWTIKAEYLYVSLGQKSLTETFLNGSPSFPQSFDARFNRTNFNVTRLGVNYRF